MILIKIETWENEWYVRGNLGIVIIIRALIINRDIWQPCWLAGVDRLHISPL